MPIAIHRLLGVPGLAFTFFSASLKAGVTLAVCQSKWRTGVASSRVQA